MANFTEAYAVSKFLERESTYLVTVNFNEDNLDNIERIVIKGNEIFLNKALFDQLGVKRHFINRSTVKFGKIDYVSISNSSDLEVTFDKPNMELRLLESVKHSSIQTIDARNALKADQGLSIKKGAFVNYNMTNTRFNKKNNFLMSPKATFFSEFGSINSESLHEISDRRKNTRLMTYYQYDNEKKLTKLVLGDAYTSSNVNLGNTVYAGLKYTTDFSIDPYYITYPSINLSRSHQLASNIDIYADNVKLYEGRVKRGQYQIIDLPVISGSGNLEVDVTDVTGNIQRISIPYYLSPALLKAGLSTYTFEAGTRRNGFGYDSNKYSGFLSNLAYRYGINNDLTASAYVQTFRDLRLAGGDLLYKFKMLGMFSSGLGYSKSSNFNGKQYSFGYEYQKHNYNIATKFTHYDKYFSDASTYPNFYTKGNTVQVFAGYSNSVIGSLNLNYLKYIRKDKFSYLGINYQNNISSKVNLLAQVGRSMGNFKSTNFLIGINFQIGNNKFINLTREHNNHHDENDIEFTKNKNENLDDFYRLRLRNSKKTRYYAEYQRQFSSLRLGLQKNNLFGTDFDQVNLQGGIVLSNGMHFTDTITDTFSVIKVHDIKGVSVKVNNNDIGKTNSHGVVASTNTVANVMNEVSFDEQSIPLNVSFKDNRKYFYPKRMKGTKIIFDIKRDYSYKANLVNAKNGKFIETASIVTIDELSNKLLVGYDGLLFLTSPKQLNSINAKVCDNNGCCKFSISGINSTEIINNLGTIVCE